MSELPRGTVTLLFTDIEGSTRMLQELGRDDYVRALEDHRRILRAAFAGGGGVEVEMQGDSFFFAFSSAGDAVAAAAAAQLALREHAWEREPIRVRMGIHTGEPVISGGLYAGLDVHRAARVMSAGHGGQVLVSQTTRDLLDDEFDLSALGAHRLKDLERPVRLYQLGSATFPPLKTLDSTNLPVAASPLVGRERELGELVALLRDGTRLLTVTGPGGTGKTRLALQAAGDLADSFTDGVFWIPLAGLRDPELVGPAIAQAVGARSHLAAAIRDKQMLLVLDNAEHLLLAAPQIGRLLAGSPRTRMLVTSRSRLRVSGEYEFPLEPLRPSDGVTLFIERARVTGRQIEPDSTIEAICRRLDGLPLAIELAAARSKLLAPKALLDRLGRALPLLTDGPRDAPKRQQTLASTIEWSYALLDEPSRHLFESLSVFAGSFSLEAAEEVCDADVPMLQALVESSLLKTSGNSRLLMLETIREFAHEQLAATRREESVRRAHAEFFARLASEAEGWQTTPDWDAWIDRLDPEVENLLAALSWLATSDDSTGVLRFADLSYFLSARGYGKFIADPLLRAVRDVAVEPADRATALSRLLFLLWDRGDVDGAADCAADLVADSRERGDVAVTIRRLEDLMGFELELKRDTDARKHHRELLRLARQVTDPACLLIAETATSSLGLCTGAWNEAALAAKRGLGFTEALTPGRRYVLLLNLMFAEVMRGQAMLALDSAAEGLELGARLGDLLGTATALEGIAGAIAPDLPEGALKLLDASASLIRESGGRLERFESAFHDRTLDLLQPIVGATRLAVLGDRHVPLAAAVELGRRVAAEGRLALAPVG